MAGSNLSEGISREEEEGKWADSRWAFPHEKEYVTFEVKTPENYGTK
jgi:hypothetical protein